MTFTVLSHHDGHLEALRDYASLWKRTDGRIGGAIDQEDLIEAHGDDRLRARDQQNRPWCEDYLVIRHEAT